VAAGASVQLLDLRKTYGDVVALDALSLDIKQGEFVANRPPHRRNIGVVFQSDALFPHMTVAASVAYPLRKRCAASRRCACR